jgi:hypothetical protein
MPANADTYPLQCFGCLLEGTNETFGLGNARTCPGCGSHEVHSPDAGRPTNVRRTSTSACAFCERNKGKMMPPHDASARCKSGGHEHCTCDTCF